ncbi:MAG TPA: PhnD/SsuA/transferrin family substrate-binding protein [Chitinophagaceae bacterium]
MKATILLIFHFLLSLLAISQAGKQSPYRLVLATYTYSTNDRLGSLRPLAEYLKQETGLEVVARSFPTVQQLMEAISKGEVDLAMINTLGYLSFQRNYPNIISPLVSLDPGGSGITNYGGCILASKRSGITSLKDIDKDKRHSLALVGNASTSGNLVPRLILNSLGVRKAEEAFNVYYAGTHKQVAEDLLTGKADIGGCGCDEFDKNVKSVEGFSEKVVNVASFNNIPLGPIVYRKTLDAGNVQKLEKALLEVHLKKPGVFREFCAGWTEFLESKKFRVSRDADYDEFRALFGDNESLWKLLNN